MTEETTPLLTKNDVCEILGVTESWLNTEIAAGNIPHLRLGRKKFIRFRPDHIEAYLATKEQNVFFVADEETQPNDVNAF